MPITISRTDYDELWREYNSTAQLSGNSSSSVAIDAGSGIETGGSETGGTETGGTETGGTETIAVVPSLLGQGWIRSIQLRGMQLYIANYQLHDDLLIKDEVFGTEWEFGFNLSGNLSGKRTGENFLDWGRCEAAGSWETYANAPILKVDLHLNSSAELYNFVSEALEELPREVWQLLEDYNRNSFYDIDTITPEMQSAVKQILHCPFQGRTKQIYIESKCLELIALKLEQLKRNQHRTRSRRLSLLKPDDIDRIHLAKAILTSRLADPPSLIELARQVNLNDYKLKVGFRQVFGTTVFGYLHQQRMETARQLLTEQRMNVREVAQAVGYASQSQFAAAFRKQFGINPKAFAASSDSEAQL